jgi:branched-chain amino acid transport system permease protein
MVADLVSTVFGGLSWGMATFLVASGLTLIFGILHILNFAQGGFFMLGAFIASTLVARLGGDVSIWSYLGVSVVAAAGVADIYVLIATYALLLLTIGAAKLIWGADPLAVAPPRELGGALFIGGAVLPTYSIFIVACGIAVYVGLELLIRCTRYGQVVQAVGLDPWTARLLGVNVGVVYSVSLVIGFGLAGLAGGLLAANQSLTTSMGDTFVIQAFGAMVVGGIGSISGAFAASLLLGLVEAFGDTYVPQYPGIFFFIGLGLMLLVRPRGFAGREKLA